METKNVIEKKYLIISPGRNEAKYLERTLESVEAQVIRPNLWVIVDDGSTDESPGMLAEFSKKHDWVRVVRKPDRGHRAVGPGVIEAFYFGLEGIDLNEYSYLCKLDLDLALPPKYFSDLIEIMESDLRIGSCSGKPYFRSRSGRWVSEKCGDEMSVGMTKFYRTSCFREIGGFVREVMWDAIDCHKARQLGWIVRSFDEPNLRFEHLRPMGSSQHNIFTGRMRHGYGQYYMGSDFFYFTATCIYRMAHPPFLVGAVATWWGFVTAWFRDLPQHDDRGLRSFIRGYQRRALVVGKRRAIAELEVSKSENWQC